ncbi:MAG: OmpA family protein [Acidimicrobiales bacterium]
MSLFEDVVFYLGRKQAVARLSAESGGDNGEAVRVGVVLSLPVVIGNLRRWLQDDEQARWFGESVAKVSPSLATDVDALLGADSVNDLANDVLDLLLGEDAPRIVELLARRAQLREGVVARLLLITTSATLAHLSTRYPTVPEPATLQDDFAAEERDLEAAGWKPWVEESLAKPQTLVTLEEWKRERALESGLVASSVDVDLAQAERASGAYSAAPVHTGVDQDRAFSADGVSGAYPPPAAAARLSGSGDLNDGDVALGGPGANDHPDPFGGSPAGSALPHSTALGTPSPMAWEEEGNWLSDRRGLLLAGAAAIVVGLLAFALLRGGDDDPATDVAAEEGADGEAASPTTNASADDSVVSGSDSTATPDAANSPVGPRSLVVPLVDPLGITEGSGTASFDFDPATGEICYDFAVVGVTSPYDGHIHVGPAGVKGGIVVDFGLLNGDTTGCIANSPAGTTAILNDLGGHYAEFHDADGVATVRAQLAEAASGVTPEEATAQNPDGAFARIEPGELVLTGEVPDQETIDKYLETFADLDPASITIVNELVIVPGAPRPSGRIVVDDTVLFDFDSSELADTDSTVLSDLATLFRARPAWSMTVVGHTDSLGTDVYNLELSLERANAVRDALIDAGVSPDVLIVRGAGSTEPIGPNDTEQGRSQNRRIEVEVIPG